MSFDAQTFDPKSEVDEAIDVLGVPKSVTVEVPEKATRKQCQKVRMPKVQEVFCLRS